MSTEPIPKGEILLKSRKSFPQWYDQLKFHCMLQCIWEGDLEPGSSIKNDPLKLPERTTLESYTKRKNEQENAKYKEAVKIWEALPEEERGEIVKPGAPKELTQEEAKSDFDTHLGETVVKIARISALSNRYDAVWNWINRTVDPSLLYAAQIQLITTGSVSLQSLISTLYDQLALLTSSTVTTIAKEY